MKKQYLLSVTLLVVAVWGVGLGSQTASAQSAADKSGKNPHWDKAIAGFNEVIRLDPKDASAYHKRGFVWYIKGDYDKAIADFNNAIKLAPTNAGAYINRGDAREKKGEYDKAIADYKQAIKLKPNDTDTQTKLKLVVAAKAKQGPIVASAPVQQQQSMVQPQQQQQSAIQTAAFGKRVALIIGNSRYRSQSILENPTRDAQLLSSTLLDVGFQTVIVKTDLTGEQTRQALREFATIADSADWALVYYAGHAIELGGVNYLIPVDALLKADRDIDIESIHIGLVQNALEGAKQLRVVILDACRDNPFASQMKRTLASRSLGRGLARIEPEAGTLVVYAAKHGEVAFDGGGKNNSPFAEALVKRINQRPGLEIRRLFDVVRDDVLALTGRKQQPFSYGSLSGSEDFFFTR